MAELAPASDDAPPLALPRPRPRRPAHRPLRCAQLPHSPFGPYVPPNLPRRTHGSVPAYDPSAAPSSSDTPPAATARHTRTIIAGCLAVCLAQIGLVLPAAINGLMQRTLHASGGELTWISDAFLVPAAVLALTFGVGVDLHGRKRLVVGAALVSAVGYLVSATSDSAAQLITGQAISGIGAAALFPASLSMITAVTTTPAARARGWPPGPRPSRSAPSSPR